MTKIVAERRKRDRSSLSGADRVRWFAARCRHELSDADRVALRAVLAELDALRASKIETYDEAIAAAMCPNCVTPWKCNGPHLPTGFAP
jgi:hypothetical protein